jgi:hypothetical protein
MGTDPVRELLFLAVRANRQANGGQGVMGTALVGAGLGMSTFWIRHEFFSIFLPCGIGRITAPGTISAPSSPILFKSMNICVQKAGIIALSSRLSRIRDPTRESWIEWHYLMFASSACAAS